MNVDLDWRPRWPALEDRRSRWVGSCWSWDKSMARWTDPRRRSRQIDLGRRSRRGHLRLKV